MFNKTLVAAAVLSVAFAASAEARDQIRIVGSSTVFPFSTAVAETFGKTTDFPTPVVESTGSGGGLKLFCAGAGLDTPDIANASRRIKASEVELCASNGVTDIVEVKIGYDGIVLANSKAAPEMDLTREQVFRALAKWVPADGGWIENPNKTWADIDPSLPAAKIEVLGPPPTSGTRDAFVELVMDEGCKGLVGKDGMDDQHCQTMREDGGFVEAGENDNLIVQKLEANPDALGIFGFSFLDQNMDKIQGSKIAGKAPSFDNIADGAYPVSRSLQFYVKAGHVGQVPGLKEFLEEFTADRAWGEDGYLADKGLIPLDDAERKAWRDKAIGLTSLKM